MPNPNMFGGMFGKPGMMQGQQGGAPPVQGMPQGPTPMPKPSAPQQGPASDSAQWMQAQADNAGADPRALQMQYDRLASQLAMAQASGAPPSIMVQMQSQLQAIQRQIQWAQEDQARSGNARLMEQQLMRARQQGAGSVGGRQNMGRANSLEDALLANSLGLGGGGMPGRR